MAIGILASADLILTTPTVVYTVPTGLSVAANINICNRNATQVKVRIATSVLATPASGEYVEYDVAIPANGVLERTALVLGSGQHIVVTSDTSLVSVVVMGIEE